MQKSIDETKKNIHTINPQITNELLDLLYEYIMIRKSNENYKSIQNDKQLNIFTDQLNIKGVITA